MLSPDYGKAQCNIGAQKAVKTGAINFLELPDERDLGNQEIHATLKIGTKVAERKK